MIAALLLSIIPYSPVIETDCDVYEVNRIYSDDGDIVLTQRILWGLPDVLGWRNVLHKDTRLTGNRILFFDRQQTPVLRLVRFGSKVESSTNYDPEMEQRSILPDGERRGLGDKP